jgi:hypothetical protein
MTISRNTYWRILTIALVLVLGSLVWVQASVSPAAAEGPSAGDTGMSVQIVPFGDDFTAASIGTTPVFYVGDTFKVSIVAQNVEDPGIFGSQFEINYETPYLQAQAGSLQSGSSLEPVVVALNEVDQQAGQVLYAASRQGNLDNVKGDVVLATLTFEAVGATEPPEGKTTTIHLQRVKLGAKGGIEVPVTGLVDLEVIIRNKEDDHRGNIEGNVKVEGRAANKQAGHQITGTGIKGQVQGVTDTAGDFMIKKAPADTYTMKAFRPGFLATYCPNVQHAATALTTLKNTTLLAGDIDSSDMIDITDAVAIGAVFGSTNVDEVANLNAEGEVDILDLILMSANYGQTSVDNPWICQGGE